MPKIVVQTIAKETINTAAAANTGRQRAVSHNNIGNSQATGTTVSQRSCDSEIITPVITASVVSAPAPSTSSLLRTRGRRAAASPISNGATAMKPIVLDVTQCSQMVRIGTVGGCSNTDATTPPIPDTEVPANAAASRPSTCRKRSRLKPAPK